MPGRITILILMLIWASGIPSVAAPATIPSWSRDRAERLDRWRALLADAERAREEDRLDDAAGYYGSVIDEAREAGDESLLLARAVDGLADTCRLRGELDDAERLYRQVAPMWERLLGPDQPRLATTLHHLGLVEWRLEHRTEAAAHLERARSIFERSFGVDSAEARNTRLALERLDESYEPAAAATTGTR
jgi:tetratricopeptide (TPR) repeat protein